MQRKLREDILKLLACPICKCGLIIFEGKEGEFLSCDNCKIIYPIRNGIPILIPEEAINIKDKERVEDSGQN